MTIEKSNFLRRAGMSSGEVGRSSVTGRPTSIDIQFELSGWGTRPPCERSSDDGAERCLHGSVSDNRLGRREGWRTTRSRPRTNIGPGRPSMKLVNWGEAPKAQWRPGNETTLHAAGSTGTERLCVGEQWFDPGVAHRPTTIPRTSKIETTAPSETKLRRPETTLVSSSVGLSLRPEAARTPMEKADQNLTTGDGSASARESAQRAGSVQQVESASAASPLIVTASAGLQGFPPAWLLPFAPQSNAAHISRPAESRCLRLVVHPARGQPSPCGPLAQAPSLPPRTGFVCSLSRLSTESWPHVAPSAGRGRQSLRLVCHRVTPCPSRF